MFFLLGVRTAGSGRVLGGFSAVLGGFSAVLGGISASPWQFFVSLGVGVRF